MAAAAPPPLRIHALIKSPPLSDCEMSCSATVAGAGEALNNRSHDRRSLAVGFRSRGDRFRVQWRDERYWSLSDRELNWIWPVSYSLRWNSWVDQQVPIAGKSRECGCRCLGQQSRRRKNSSARWPGFDRTGGPLGAFGARGLSLRSRLILEENGEGALNRKRRSNRTFRLWASRDPYETLGVPTTATDKEIKQAYRKLALKFHPDVNREPDAQQKFLQIKTAYQILIDEKDRAKYDRSRRSSTSWDPFARQAGGKSAQKQREEEFYGFGDFFRDFQEERRTRPASKPKSLWEELADIGEEFVEFLEKELNISDTTVDTEKRSSEKAWDERRTTDDRGAKKNYGSAGGSKSRDTQADKEREKADIEEMLAQLKKEMGM